jgi:hypothetical protein
LVYSGISSSGVSSATMRSAMKVLLGRQSLALDDGVGDLAGEQPDGPQRVVVAGDDVVHFIRIAVGVDHRYDGNAQLARLLDGDRLLVGVDDEQRVRQPAPCP